MSDTATSTILPTELDSEEADTPEFEAPGRANLPSPPPSIIELKTTTSDSVDLDLPEPSLPISTDPQAESHNEVKPPLDSISTEVTASYTPTSEPLQYVGPVQYTCCNSTTHPSTHAQFLNRPLNLIGEFILISPLCLDVLLKTRYDKGFEEGKTHFNGELFSLSVAAGDVNAEDVYDHGWWYTEDLEESVEPENVVAYKEGLERGYGVGFRKGFRMAQ